MPLWYAFCHLTQAYRVLIKDLCVIFIYNVQTPNSLLYDLSSQEIKWPYYLQDDRKQFHFLLKAGLKVVII